MSWLFLYEKMLIKIKKDADIDADKIKIPLSLP